MNTTKESVSKMPPAKCAHEGSICTKRPAPSIFYESSQKKQKTKKQANKKNNGQFRPFHSKNKRPQQPHEPAGTQRNDVTASQRRHKGSFSTFQAVGFVRCHPAILDEGQSERQERGRNRAKLFYGLDLSGRPSSISTAPLL